MKLVLDEWIVREVIDTLYMARTTFLGITGLDSPQEVEKKSANETAITRRISKAINIIQQSEQPHIPEGLEEAAETIALPYEEINNTYEHSNIIEICKTLRLSSFKAGAKWDRAKIMESAVEGVVQDDGQFINFGDGRYIDLDPTMGLKPVFELTDGDKVKVIVIPEEK